MKDDLERYVDEREEREPGFKALVEAAARRRALAKEWARLVAAVCKLRENKNG